jgi:DNA polymerase III subunit delta
MPVLSTDALFRALKRNALDPVYYLYGDEDVLKEDVVDALRDAILEPSTRDFNCDIRDATDVNAESLDTLVDTPPMLAERRLVVLWSIEGWKAKAGARERLVRYLQKPNPSTVLVLIQGAGEEPVAEYSRSATVVNLEPLAPERAAKWVAHRAKKAGLAIEPEAAEHLVKAVAGDLRAITSELGKLGGVAVGRAITAADVAQQVGVRHGETAYDLTDAALARDGARAAQLVRSVLAQSDWSGVRVLSLLGTMLIGLALARAEMDRGRRGRALIDALVDSLRRARPRSVRRYGEEAERWARSAEQWTAAEIRAAIAAALAADQALKNTTLTDEVGILEQLVLGFAVRSEVAA